MHAVDIRLAVFDNDIAVLQVERARTHGFDLGPPEFDPGFVLFLNKVVVERLAVVRHDLDSLFLRHGASAPLKRSTGTYDSTKLPGVQGLSQKSNISTAAFLVWFFLPLSRFPFCVTIKKSRKIKVEWIWKIRSKAP